MYKNVRPKAIRNDRVAITTTYTDEDGDEITISSDEELADAFTQFVNSVPPVVRAKSVVGKKKAATKNAESKESTKIEEKTNSAQNRVDIRAPTSVPTAPVKRVAVPSPPKKVAEDRTNSLPAGIDPNFIHGRHTCDGCLTTPIFGVRYHAKNLPDYDLCSNCHTNYKGTDLVFEPQQLDRDRHLQLRWQRRQIRRSRPMARTVGVGAVPSARSCAGHVPSGTQTRKVIESMDDALKEAVRRSLLESWPSKKKENKEKEEKAKSESQTVKTHEETISVDSSTKENENEIDIPVVEKPKEDTKVPDVPAAPVVPQVPVVPAVPIVPQVPVVVPVVDISPGNEHTKKTLETMDPKVKEALSRSLNAFFSRRLNKNEYSSQEASDLLSPTNETQRKINSMDPKTKDAIRRSLNQFFADRRAANLSGEESEGQKKDQIKRTQAILDTMDTETKGKLNDFFSSLSKKKASYNNSEDEETKNEITSVVVDIIVDDDDEDLSHGIESFDASNASRHEQKSTDINHDSDLKLSEESDVIHQSESKLSDESETKEGEWQMVSEDDEMIAVAAQMLGSALFQSDASLAHDSNASS